MSKPRQKLIILKEKQWAYPKVFIEVGGGYVRIEFEQFMGAFKAEMGNPIKYQTKKALDKAIDVAFEKIKGKMRDATEQI